jgi:hypothetical protein
MNYIKLNQPSNYKLPADYLMKERYYKLAACWLKAIESSYFDFILVK